MSLILTFSPREKGLSTPLHSNYFLSHPPLGMRVTGYSEAAPDLVVEIVSPSDTFRGVNDKALMWLHYGVTLVWVADPDTRTIDVHQSGAPVATFTEDDTLDGGSVLPGFTLAVREVFE